MSDLTSSLPKTTSAAWAAAQRQTAGRIGFDERLAQPSDDLLQRFALTYTRLQAMSRQQRRRLQRRLQLGLAGVALLVALGLAPSTALAGTITVNGATCTLADAITTANTGTNTGGCTGGSLGADTINLTVNVSLSSGLPAITSAITLEGNGHSIQRSSGSPGFSVLAVTSSGNLTLKQATINGGSAYNGGGINNAGMVTVQNSTLFGNTAVNIGGGILNTVGATLMVQNSTLSGNTGYTGGGIRNFGAATVQSSTLSGNSASYYGGGIGNIGTMTVQNSTISGNSGGLYGGGINNYGELTVQNSTLSGNSAAQGGGIRSYIGILDVQDSTVSGNSAAAGGGIHNSFGTVAVQNSLVALQVAGADCVGSLDSGGYNIESGTSCGFTGTGDLQNQNAAALALGALANNGGPTETRGLGSGSVAIDRIPVSLLEANGCTGATTDQRGAPRAAGPGAGGAACDVGAYEANSVPLAIMLARFDAQFVQDRVSLTWETASELGNGGFNLWRGMSPAGPDIQLNGTLIPSQSPGSSGGFTYTWEDSANLIGGTTYYYWLEDVSLSGVITRHGPANATVSAPTAVTLGELHSASPASPGWLAGLVRAVQDFLAGLYAH